MITILRKAKMTLVMSWEEYSQWKKSSLETDWIAVDEDGYTVGQR